jgi:hypothetical protein
MPKMHRSRHATQIFAAPRSESATLASEAGRLLRSGLRTHVLRRRLDRRRARFVAPDAVLGRAVQGCRQQRLDDRFVTHGSLEATLLKVDEGPSAAGADAGYVTPSTVNLSLMF